MPELHRNFQIKRFAHWSSMFEYEADAIRLHEMSWMQGSAGFTFPWPSGVDRVLFVYTLSGGGTVDFSGSLYSLSPGQAFLANVQPGYVAQCSGDSWDFIWIQMSGALANRLLAHVLEEQHSPVFSTSMDLLPICEQIYICASAEVWTKEADIQIASCLYQLLGILHNAAFTPRRVEPALKRIHNQYMESLALEELAQDCLMSYFHFIRCFKEDLGVTPHVYINIFRINQAKEMLLRTDRSIANIAAAVGFEDPSYFSRLFKKQTGYHPRDFRRFSRL